MATETKQARSATTALIYLTVGALMDVWTVIYYIYLSRHEGTDTQYLWCYGFLFSGIVLIVIGLAVGRIGRHARQAETGATPDVAINPTTPSVSPSAAAPMNSVVQPVAVVPQAPPAPTPTAAMPPSRQTTHV